MQINSIPNMMGFQECFSRRTMCLLARVPPSPCCFSTSTNKSHCLHGFVLQRQGDSMQRAAETYMQRLAKVGASVVAAVGAVRAVGAVGVWACTGALKNQYFRNRY